MKNMQMPNWLESKFPKSNSIVGIVFIKNLKAIVLGMTQYARYDWRRAVFTPLILVLAGCATAPSTSIERPPLAINPDSDSSVIIGQTIGGILNNRIYLISIEGESIPDPLATAAEPLRIHPGQKQIVVGQAAGGFNAAIDLTFTAEPNKSYRVRAIQNTDKPWYSQQIYSAGGETFFWVENYATGEIVCERKTVNVGINGSSPQTVVVPKKK